MPAPTKILIEGVGTLPPLQANGSNPNLTGKQYNAPKRFNVLRGKDLICVLLLMSAFDLILFLSRLLYSCYIGNIHLFGLSCLDEYIIYIAYKRNDIVDRLIYSL